MPFREIAQVIGRRLNIPVVSKSPREAEAHFGWFAHFVGLDCPASSALVEVPVDRLLSKGIRQRRSLIDLNRTMPIATAGDFEQPGDSHTTHLNVVDAEGNMVSLTQTLGAIFGSGVIAADTGVLFSDGDETFTSGPEGLLIPAAGQTIAFQRKSAHRP